MWSGVPMVTASIVSPSLESYAAALAKKQKTTPGKLSVESLLHTLAQNNHKLSFFNDHLAVVAEFRSIGEAFGGLRIFELLAPCGIAGAGDLQRFRIHITHADDAHFGVLQHTHHRDCAHAADADGGHLEHGVRRLGAQDGGRGNVRGGRDGEGLLEEAAAVHGGRGNGTGKQALSPTSSAHVLDNCPDQPLLPPCP